MSLLSVVVPVYGCDTCLRPLCERLQAVFAKLKLQGEIILVCDRSPDNSWVVIQQICNEMPFVKGILFSRNFGQHYAITAGLDYAKGDYCVVMDCDLQDPPEEIEKLYLKAQEGFDIVYGYAAFRGKKNRAMQFFRNLYFKMYDWLVGTGYQTVNLSFFLMKRKPIEAYKQYRDKSRHLASIIRDLGFSFGGVEVQHEEREQGKSSYSLTKRVKLAVNGLIMYSSFFLRVSLIIGFVFSTVAIGLACLIIYNRIFEVEYYPGWTSLIAVVLLSSGLIMSFLGIIGLYIQKIFMEVRERPLYIIDELLNNG
jgi:polyisoprenyl-phosphate glycosyltransferase